MKGKPWIISRWLYPELLLFPTPESRKSAGLSANKVIWRSRRFWLGFILAMAAFDLAPQLAIKHHLLRGTPSAIVFCLALFGIYMTLLVKVVIPIADVRRHLRVSLVESGIPICIECGYMLVGNMTGRCPECGTANSDSLKSAIANWTETHP